MLSQEELVNKLTNPSNYSHKTDDEIRIIETNISWIFLTGQFVYKMKKNIQFGDVLDFSTLDKRKQACYDEISLNRRLAPEIYLSVESVDNTGSLNPENEPIEFLVKMKELPQESLLSNKLINEKSISNDTIIRIAQRIASFHKENIVHPNFSIYENIYEKCDENFRTTKQYPNFPYNKILERRVYRFLKENKEFWENRKTENKIIDGHGDLILANIFDDKNEIIIFDCIEFNESLRIQDTIEEVAFLAMDLDYHGLFKQSILFLETYLNSIGDTMKPSSHFINFYKSYRAYVRAKVYCSLSLQDISEIEKKELLQKTEKYMKLANSYEF